MDISSTIANALNVQPIAKFAVIINAANATQHITTTHTPVYNANLIASHATPTLASIANPPTFLLIILANNALPIA